MADIVNMMMFVEHGKEYPEKLKLKGLVNSESLLGYGNYTSRGDSRDEKQKMIEEEEMFFSNGYLDYTSRNSSRKDDDEIKTYTSNGWIEGREERDLFKSNIKKYFSKDGDLAWMPVTSFKDYFTAEQYGLMKEEDYAVVFQKVLPKFFSKVNMDPKNMIWWFDYHTNKGHPHTHLVFLEKEKTRRKGTFTKKDMNYFKGMIISEAEKRMDLIKGISSDKVLQFKKKDLLRKNLKEIALEKLKIHTDEKINKKIEKLFKKIDKEVGSGRLQLGSYNMKNYRDDVYDIVDEILDHPDVINKKEEFLDILKSFDSSIENKLGSEYSALSDLEMEKLKKEIGNHVLSMKKEMLYTAEDEEELINKVKASAVKDNIIQGQVDKADNFDRCEEAKILKQKGQLNEANKILEKIDEPHATMMLAWNHYENDKRKSKKYFKKAADQGSLQAQEILDDFDNKKYAKKAVLFSLGRLSEKTNQMKANQERQDIDRYYEGDQKYDY